MDKLEFTPASVNNPLSRLGLGACFFAVANLPQTFGGAIVTVKKR
jgi:hypothetical protein